MATKFLLSLLARILPLTIAFIFAFYSDSETVKLAAYFSGIVILIVAEYVGIFRPLVGAEDQKKKMLGHGFKQFADSASKRKAAIRLNVMLAKWSWVRRHFYQYYQHGMAGHPDANLHFPISKGFCGQAFREKKHEVHFIDLRGMAAEKIQELCGFSKKQMEMTAGLKAIACIPLYKETKTIRGNPKTTFYGILNVDTVENDGAVFLSTEQTQKQIKELAALVQLTLN